MDITSKPNLKPYRIVDEHDIIDLFSHVDATANKGSLVTINTAVGNTNVWNKTGTLPPTPHLNFATAIGNTPAWAFTARNEVTWKVIPKFSLNPDCSNIHL